MRIITSPCHTRDNLGRQMRFDIVVELAGEAIYSELSLNEETALERATELRHAIGPEAVTIEWRG